MRLLVLIMSKRKNFLRLLRFFAITWSFLPCQNRN